MMMVMFMEVKKTSICQSISQPKLLSSKCAQQLHRVDLDRLVTHHALSDKTGGEGETKGGERNRIWLAC